MNASQLNRLQVLEHSRLYRMLKNTASVLDRYYLDALLGFVPGGVGDIATALFSLVYVYFGAVHLKSPALTVALLNNTVRDVLIGLIPFHVGDVLDIFHRSNSQNMRLVEGYVHGDPVVIHEVKSRVWQSVAAIVLMLAVIVGLLWIAVKAITAFTSLF